PDPTDRASLEDNRNLMLRIRDRERKLISKIDEALGRIDDGSYGKCEECGSDIGIARLKTRPVTTLCIDSKSLQEAQERRLRTTSRSRRRSSTRRGSAPASTGPTRQSRSACV